MSIIPAKIDRVSSFSQKSKWKKKQSYVKVLKSATLQKWVCQMKNQSPCHRRYSCASIVHLHEKDQNLVSKCEVWVKIALVYSARRTGQEARRIGLSARRIQPGSPKIVKFTPKSPKTYALPLIQVG